MQTSMERIVGRYKANSCIGASADVQPGLGPGGGRKVYDRVVLGAPLYHVRWSALFSLSVWRCVACYDGSVAFPVVFCVCRGLAIHNT